MRHALAEQRNRQGDKRIQPAEKGKRAVLPGGNAERRLREACAGAVGHNAAEHGAGVLQGAAQVLRLQAVRLVQRAEEPSRHDDGHILLPCSDDDAPRREHRGDHQPAIAVDVRHNPPEHGFRHAGALVDAGKAQRQQHERDGAHHAHEAAAVQQRVHRLHAGVGRKAVHHCAQKLTRRHTLHKHGGQKAQRCRTHEAGQGRDPEDHHEQHEQRRQQEQRVDHKVFGQRVERQADLRLVHRAVLCVDCAQNAVNHQADEVSGRRRHHHVAHMVKQPSARDGGGQVCRVGKRGHFIPEVCAGHNRAHRDGGWDTDGGTHAEQRNAHRADGGERAADRQGNERAEQKRRHQEKGGRDDLQAVVHHRGNHAARHPRGNENADGENDEQGRHGGRDGVCDALEHLVPGVAVHGAHKGCQHGRQQQRHVRAGAEPHRERDDEREQGEKNEKRNGKPDRLRLPFLCFH